MEVKTYSEWLSANLSIIRNQPDTFYGKNTSIFNYVQAYIYVTNKQVWTSHIEAMDWATDNKIPDAEYNDAGKIKK